MFVKKLMKQVISEPDYPLVKTDAGLLRGLIVDGTYIFRGVKYADAKRFRMPTPVEKWDGIRDAIEYGTVCPEVSTVLPDDQYTVPHVFYPQHEDCQYLNVWTRELDPAAKKPVMVWLHGGGFATGSGIEHFAYDGENLAREGGVVVVTLNHRLNLLGFMDLREYGEEYRYSGICGMADIVAALDWVRRNIASFGGDPDNVTIFGQSGGGGKVAALLQIPAADGLFHRAVIQSGMFPRGGSRPQVNRAPEILASLGITKDNIHDVDTIPYWRLADAVEKLGPRAGMGFGPVADGEYYLGDAYQVGVCEHAKTVPVMIGNVLGEFCNNFVRTIGDGRKNTWSEETRVAMIREAAGENADGLIESFRAAYPGRNIADLLFIDPMFRSGVLDYSKMRAEAGCVTYDYVFALEMPPYGGTLPWHNAEIPYVFRNADYIEPSYIPGVTEAVQKVVSTAWTSFARDGKPSAPDMPEWKPFTADEHNTMIFDETAYAVKAHDEEFISRLREAGALQLTRVVRGRPAVTFGGGPRTVEPFRQRENPIPDYGK